MKKSINKRKEEDTLVLRFLNRDKRLITTCLYLLDRLSGYDQEELFSSEDRRKQLFFAVQNFFKALKKVKTKREAFATMCIAKAKEICKKHKLSYCYRLDSLEAAPDQITIQFVKYVCFYNDGGESDISFDTFIELFYYSLSREEAYDKIVAAKDEFIKYACEEFLRFFKLIPKKRRMTLYGASVLISILSVPLGLASSEDAYDAGGSKEKLYTEYLNTYSEYRLEQAAIKHGNYFRRAKVPK